jgi:hypothetical protein
MNIKKYISISKDTESGKLIGVPVELANYNFNLDIDLTKTIIEADMPESVKTGNLP